MPAPFTLYGVNFSGPTYKAALGLTLMEVPFDFVATTPRGDAKTPAFLKLNAFGQVPCLVDKKTGRAFRQAPSILEVLADRSGKYGGQSAEERVEMREWMYWDLDRLAPPLYRMRGQRLGFRQFGQSVAEMYNAEGLASLQALEDHLGDHKWLVGRRASIADIDVYGVLEFAAPGGFNFADFPNVEAYMRRFQDLKGFGHPADIIPPESRKA
jgi:glutathione S-transferase